MNSNGNKVYTRVVTECGVQTHPNTSEYARNVCYTCHLYANLNDSKVICLKYNNSFMSSNFDFLLLSLFLG